MERALYVIESGMYKFQKLDAAQIANEGFAKALKEGSNTKSLYNRLEKKLIKNEKGKYVPARCRCECNCLRFRFGSTAEAPGEEFWVVGPSTANLYDYVAESNTTNKWFVVCDECATSRTAGEDNAQIPHMSFYNYFNTKNHQLKCAARSAWPRKANGHFKSPAEWDTHEDGTIDEAQKATERFFKINKGTHELKKKALELLLAESTAVAAAPDDDDDGGDDRGGDEADAPPPAGDEDGEDDGAAGANAYPSPGNNASEPIVIPSDSDDEEPDAPTQARSAGRGGRGAGRGGGRGGGRGRGRRRAADDDDDYDWNPNMR